MPKQAMVTCLIKLNLQGILVKCTNNMTNIEEKINDILSEWNPLCVDTSVSRNEYKKYIPSILASKDNWGELRNAWNL